MNCQEVEMQLSEYLDGALDGGWAREIASHLNDCPRCNAELESLANCKRLVSSLPAVEPPAGLTARVMAQVHDGVRRPGIWQRLFGLLPMKISLEATAIVLIGILAIYVYRKEQGHRYFLSVPADRLSAQPEGTRDIGPRAPLASTEKQGSRAESKARSSLPEATKPTRRKSTSLPILGEATRAAPETSAPAAPPSALADKKDLLDNAAADYQNLSEETARSSPGAAGSGAPALQAWRRERTGTGESSADSAASRPDQPAPDYELVVRLRAPERRDQRPADSIDLLGKSVETDHPLRGRNASEMAASPTAPARPRTVWYSVPQNRYEQFKRTLAAQSMIESETPTFSTEKEAARKPEELLSIKVTILPPR
jgi:anti-sigma factor RsiW